MEPLWVKRLSAWMKDDCPKLAETDLVLLTYVPTNRRCMLVSSPKGLVLYYHTQPDLSNYSLKTWYGDKNTLIKQWEFVCTAYIDLRNDTWRAKDTAIKEIQDVRTLL